MLLLFIQNVIYKDRDTRQDHSIFEPQSCRNTNENLILMK